MKLERNAEVKLPDGRTGRLASGKIRQDGTVLVNLWDGGAVSVPPENLAPYFGYGELCDTILLRHTASLSQHVQQIGRAVRPDTGFGRMPDIWDLAFPPAQNLPPKGDRGPVPASSVSDTDFASLEIVAFASVSVRRKWEGSPYEGCDLCNRGPGKVFYDVSLLTHGGSWARVCHLCFQANRCTLGAGRGQKYVREYASDGSVVWYMEG